MAYDLKDYVEVSERIVKFREKYPDGSLQAEILRYPEPDFPWVVVKAYAYRTPDDHRPGTGLAWEPFPGRTPYTKESELMVAETSAWGRALIACGAADAKRGIASADEVRNRQQPKKRAGSGATASRPDPEPQAAPAPASKPAASPSGDSPPGGSAPPGDERQQALFGVLDGAVAMHLKGLNEGRVTLKARRLAAEHGHAVSSFADLKGAPAELLERLIDAFDLKAVAP